MSITRRHFFASAAAFSAGFAGLERFTVLAGSRSDGYGPLIPDPHRIFDLPRGFTYTVISRPGDPMADGFLVPTVPDGMAAFEGPGGHTLVVRNHEINIGVPGEDGPFGPENQLLEKVDRAALYDAGTADNPSLGGTTTFVYDTHNQRLVSQHLSLVGTVRNCAGGPTPWGSWITCEESTQAAGELTAKDHGYNFEVPATAEPKLADPIPLKAMGRFNHEAIAVDPQSGVVYETEDRHDGLIYRFIPNTPGRLQDGGRLQALVIKDRPSLDTRNWEETTVTPGTWMDVEWIDLDDVEAPNDDLRYRGFEAGAARFARGEGMWYGNDAVYFACTNGGKAKSGQVWMYRPSGAEGTDDEANEPGRVQLFIEPNDPNLVENCDNVTVAPWGDLVMCEDGPGETFLVGVTPEGSLYRLGRNALSNSEVAGATFSPDGTTLFINIQQNGWTLAITGPWRGYWLR